MSFQTEKQVDDKVRMNLLDHLTQATETKTEEKIEIVKLQLERERLALDAAKARREGSFWVKNFGVSVTSIVSLAAILVSLSQVWVAKIQKDKELAIAQQQKQKEHDAAAILQERTWKLDSAKFVMDHADKLFGNDKDQRMLVTSVMLATFPTEFSGQLLSRLETVAPSDEAREEFRNLRTTVLPKIKDSMKFPGTSMLPSMRDGQSVVFERFDLGSKVEGKRGEVVTLWFPDDPSKSIIKRIIGLSGDTVEIREGVVIINGQKLDEPYVDSRLNLSKRSQAMIYVKPIITMFWVTTAIIPATREFGD